MFAIRKGLAFFASILIPLTACSKLNPTEVEQSKGSEEWPSEKVWHQKSYQAGQQEKVLLKNFKILPANGPAFEGDVAISGGKIIQVGNNIKLAGARVVEGRGRYLTPGLIDTHSHIGVYPMPSVSAHSDGNEATSPQTASVWAEHSFWPQDPALWRALAGGVTTHQILPGSANLFGGRTVTVRTVPKAHVADMKFPGAPHGLKMACGENPKRVYGDKGGPSTRMGNYAGYRKEFQKAWEYREELRAHQKELNQWESEGKKDKRPKPPAQQHDMDTLAKVLDGDILVHIHCYRADEMLGMMDLANTFGFKIRSFHHALEAYKIAPQLAAQEISVSTWADWWGFKMEAFDGIPYNLALTHRSGGRAIVHSDSSEDIRFLNIEAAKGQAAGRLLGIEIPDDEVIKWITAYPAWALGIEDQVGVIAKDKVADLVIWDGSPFSSYSKVDAVYVAGELQFHRKDGLIPGSDFETGILDEGIMAKEARLYTLGRPTPPQFEVPQQALQLPDGAKNFIIANARAFAQDGSLKKVSVAVRGQKLVAIVWEDQDSTKLPEWPKIEAQGRLLTPGFIDPQTTLGLVAIELERQSNDLKYGEAFSPGFDAIDGIDPFSLRIPIEREHGVTSVVVKPSGGLIAGQGALLDLSLSSAAVHQDRKYLFASVTDRHSTRGHFWLHLREAFDDAIALKRQMGFTSQRPLATHLSLSPAHLEPLLGVLSGKLPLVLNLDRLSDVYAAARFKRDMKAKGHNMDLIIVGARESWLAADLLAQAKIPVVVTPTQQLPSSLDRLRVRDDLAAYLDSNGVKVIFSANDLNVRRLRQQAGRAVAYGLAYHKALEAITGGVADVMGLKDRGKLTTGRRADLVVWDGDPLEPQGKVAAMWIAGNIQSMKNRQWYLGRRYFDRELESH